MTAIGKSGHYATDSVAALKTAAFWKSEHPLYPQKQPLSYYWREGPLVTQRRRSRLIEIWLVVLGSSARLSARIRLDALQT